MNNSERQILSAGAFTELQGTTEDRIHEGLMELEGSCWALHECKGFKTVNCLWGLPYGGCRRGPRLPEVT